MNKRGLPYHWQNSELLLSIYVQPKAQKEGYNGLHDQRIKFRVAAAPADGLANQRLCELLAKVFAVPKKSITIVRGHASRHKTISVEKPQKLPEWIASPPQPV